MEMVFSLVPILTSRFMLNLRQASECDDDAVSDVVDPGRHLTSDKSTLGFRIPQSVTGDLGESFVDEPEVDVELDEATAAAPDSTERVGCTMSGKKTRDGIWGTTR